MRQQHRILLWQSANGKYNVGNAVVERIRCFRRLARNPGCMVGLSMDLVH